MDKKTALAQLRQSRFAYERGLARQDAERRTKLHRFLDQYKHASQWATSVAALEDAIRHGVTPNDDALCRTMRQCGLAGKLAVAKRLYTDVYRKIGRPRPLAAHVAFLSACADAGDFAEAHRQFVALRDRDVALHAKHAAHRPVVTDDLTTEYLRAALCATLAQESGGARVGRIPTTGAASLDASAQGSSRGVAGAGGDAASTEGCDGRRARPDTTPEGEPRSAAAAASAAASAAPWQTALETFVELRKSTMLFRPSNELTPLLLEHATQLACAGRQWQLCLAILRGAEVEQALIPPEAYDAAIRACFRAQRHTDVVRLTEQLIATRVAPDERSVRLALTSAEEVSAMERGNRPAAALTASAEPPLAGAAQVRRTVGWSLALTLFQALERNGFPLYQQSYEAPLRSCANAGRWEEAFKMLDVMRRDHRPVSSLLYAQALAARIEAATTAAELQRLLRASALEKNQQASVVLYLAALRACMRLGDWKQFAKLNREMRDRDVVETYDKMRLLIEAAYLQQNYHSVLMRFARFENITQYERNRVVKDQLVRLYEADFELSAPLLEMVLDAYTKLQGNKDSMAEAAYQAALRYKERQTGQQTLAGDHTQPDEWMYSQAAREARTPLAFV